MRYRVFWSPQAEDRLEHFLATAANPDVIAHAARAIDRQLVANPKDFGESREGAFRVAFNRPLGVHYDVMEDIRTVIVHDVWRFG